MKWIADQFLRQFEGFFVGSLGDDEIEVFDLLVKAGFARRSYEGAGGFMGLAKVRAALTTRL